jgi:hypothetical protein
MRRFPAKTLLLLLSFSLLTCHVQKRKYQKGFYVESVLHSPEKSYGASFTAKTNASHKRKVPVIKISNDNVPAVTVPVTEALPVSKLSFAADQTAHKKNRSHFSSPDSCDLLTFKDGAELRVKVMEINVTDIKYRRCDNKPGPVYLVKKSLIFKVTYTNGSSEVIKGEPGQVQASVAAPAAKSQKSDRPMHPTAPYSLATAIASFLMTCYDFAVRDASTGPIPPIHLGVIVISALLAVIFGRLALNDIKARPGTYRGNSLAVIGSLVGAIILGMFALMALFFVLLP